MWRRINGNRDKEPSKKLKVKRIIFGSIPIFQKYVVVGASCSLDIKRGQDARTTNLNIWDAPLHLVFCLTFLIFSFAGALAKLAEGIASKIPCRWWIHKVRSHFVIPDALET